MATKHTVCDYQTGNTLDGVASGELVRMSEETVEGAVSAYRDDAGTWQYVMPGTEDFYRRQRREDVRTVYVES